jgi:hypothetical protein
VLLNLRGVLQHVYISVIGPFLGYLDLASAHPVGYDVLGRGLTILHIGYLGLSLRATLSDSLYSSDDLLVVLARGGSVLVHLLARLGLVDLEFENSVI